MPRSSSLGFVRVATLIGVLSIALLAAAGSRAADDDIVISANRVATKASEVGSSVTVITAKDLERRGTLLVSDILREVPGVAVSRSGGIGGQTAVRIRGAEANHTVLIVDGIEVNDPEVALARLENLTASAVERIEILRGAQSVLYGADAIGGVIQIITKKGSGPPKTSGRVEYGSHKTWITSVGTRGSSEKLDYALNVSRLSTNGISSAKGKFVQSGSKVYNPENDAYKNLELSGKFGYQASANLRFNTVLRYVASDADQDQWGRDSNDEQKTDELEAKLSAVHAAFDGKLTQTFAYSYLEFGDKTKGSMPRSEATGRRNKLEYQGDIKLSEAQRLTLGGEYEKEEFDRDSTSIDETLRNSAVFIEYGITLLSDLNLVAGGRLDDQDIYGREYTYRLAASYLIRSSDTRVKASLGSGFASPTPYELFGGTFFFAARPPWFPNDTYYAGGNQNLNAEKSRSWDIGVEQSLLDDRLELGITYFENDIEDMVAEKKEILPLVLPDSTTPLTEVHTFDNISKSFTRGIEMTVQASPLEGLDVSASYTYQRPTNKDTHEDLVRRARHLGSLNVNYQFFESFEANLGVLYNGKQDDVWGVVLDDYTLVNLALSYQVNDKLRLIGRIENLFNEKYEEVSTFGTLDRVGYLGFRFEF